MEGLCPAILTSIQNIESHLLELKNAMVPPPGTQKSQTSESVTQNGSPLRSSPKNLNRMKQLRLFKHGNEKNKFKMVFKLPPGRLRLNEKWIQEFDIKEPVFNGYFLEHSGVKEKLIHYLQKQRMEAFVTQGNVLHVRSYEGHSDIGILDIIKGFLKDLEKICFDTQEGAHNTSLDHSM